MADNPRMTGKTQKPMTSLLVTSGTKTYSSQGSWPHRVVVLLVRLDISTKFQSSMTLEVQCVPSHYVSG